MNLPEGIDHTAVEKLKKLGFVLEGKRTVEFYFYFREEHKAHFAAAELQNLHFDTNISHTEPDSDWLCLATKSINFTEERLADLREWMEDLARRHGGRYDGWGTGFSL